MASPASNASRTPESSGAESPSNASSPTSSARPAADVVAITVRDDFLLELGEALGGQASVRPVDSLAGALELVVGARRQQILVIDTRDVADVRADVDATHAQAPGTPILVFAQSDAEKQVAAALRGSDVFAVLPIPVDRRKTAAVFEGAIADAANKRSVQRSAPAMEARSGSVSVEYAPQPAGAADDTDSGSSNRMIVFGGAGLALALIAAGAFWFFTKQDAAEPAGQATAPQAQAASGATESEGTLSDEELLGPAPEIETSIVSGRVDELLEKARLAMRERRYTEPTGDNALLYYRSAAAADPANGEALDGLSRVGSLIATRFEEAMAEGNFDDAAVALANLKSATPNEARVAELEAQLVTAQITQALANDNVDRAAALVRQATQRKSVPAEELAKLRDEVSRRQDEARLLRLVDLVNARIREGRLTVPANNSAKHYLALLENVPGSASAHQRLARELNAAYLREARQAALAGRSSEADAWVAEARAGGASASEISAWQRDVAGAQKRASAAAEIDRLADLAKARIGEGKLTEPAEDNAAYYLAALRAADSDNSGLAPLSRDLAAKLLERARAAARDGDAAKMDADLAAAKSWGADAKDIQAVQQLANNNRNKPASSRANAAGSTPSGSSSQPSLADLQARLKRTRYVAPEYPDRALSQRLGGTVVIEFVVGTDGDTRDVRVVSAEPAGVFDRSAVSAVRRWRYEPVIVDNVPTEVPARTAIRFELPK